MRRCNACGGLPKSYSEVWSGHCIEFSAGADGLPGEEGYFSDGQPTHVIAECADCGHTWRLRGIRSISDLRAAHAGERKEPAE